jgi:hypothetical protein
MPTNFPTSVDNFANPTPTDSLNAPAHSTQHANANDAIEAIESYLLNGQGLTLVKKQTIGTAVSSVTVTGAFSATYDNYKIVISGGVASTASYLRLSLDGATTSYKYNLIYADFGTASVFVDTSAATSYFNYAGSGTTQGLFMNTELVNPFLAKNTYFSAPTINASVGGNCVGIHPVATSYSGFVVAASSGTLTGGTIYVYGYGVGQ